MHYRNTRRVSCWCAALEPSAARKVLGRGLKDLPRDQIVVATKVGRYGQDVFDFSAARVKARTHPLNPLASRRGCFQSALPPWWHCHWILGCL
jgi:hypothetical protein